MSYTCLYCKASFVKEKTLAVHLCEPKRRFLQRNHAGVRIAYQTFLKFYEIAYGSSQNKTYDDFDKHSFYNAFVKFGEYCVYTRVFAPMRFAEFLLKNHMKHIDRWTASDKYYDEFLVSYLRVEDVNDALTRAHNFATEWAAKTGNPSKDCLRYGSTGEIVKEIVAGRLSPWVIYNCESGRGVLGSLDEIQTRIVMPYIDPTFWENNFNQNKEDQLYVKDILSKVGW